MSNSAPRPHLASKKLPQNCDSNAALDEVVGQSKEKQAKVKERRRGGEKIERACYGWVVELQAIFNGSSTCQILILFLFQRKVKFISMKSQLA